MSKDKKEKAKTEADAAEKDGDLLRSEMAYDISRIRDYLNSEQLDVLDEFRKSLPTDHIDEYATHWLTDATLCRFLRARQWDLDKARTMLANTLKWRAEYKPHLITAEDVKSELDNPGKMYRGGFDKHGRPILIMKPGKDNTGADQREMKVKFLVYLMEKCALAANKNKHEKLLLIIDMKDNNQMAGLATMKTNREVLSVLQDHYPESLGTACIVNHPWTFSLFWNMIYPFIDPITREKIHMMSKFEKFLEYIDEKELEECYGGKNDFQWNFEKHWKKEDDEHPAWSPKKEPTSASSKQHHAHHKKHKKHSHRAKKDDDEDEKESRKSETDSDTKDNKEPAAVKKVESSKHPHKK